MIELMKNTLKLMFRTKSLMFWTFIFPIVLSTLFFVAIKPAYEGHIIDEPIKVAVVNQLEESEESKIFIDVLESIEINGEVKLADATLMNYEEAFKMLKNKEVGAIYLVGEDIRMETKTVDTTTYVLESVATSYNQQQELFVKAMNQYGPEVALELMQSEFNVSIDNIELKNNDTMSLQYYTVFGMSCFYSAYWGMATSSASEANQSPVGARKMVAPTSKSKLLLSDYIVCFAVSFFCQIIVFLYMRYALGMQVGDYAHWMILLIGLGCLAGISWGKIVATALKVSENTKSGILTAIPLIGSVLTGMMSLDVKRMVDTTAPIINRLNPMNWISEGMYSLYVYGVNTQYFKNVISLAIFTVAVFVLSLILGRRKQYESL